MIQVPHSRRLLATVMSIFTIAAAGMVAPVSAGATGPRLSSMSVVASQTHATTSTGDKVTVQVSAHREFESIFSPSMNVSVSRAGELHVWRLPIKSADFKLSTGGRGTLSPAPVRVAPLGVVRLSITPNGAATVHKCQGQVISRSQPVKIAGTFFFDTDSGPSGWGTLGSQTKNFAFTTSASARWQYETETSCGETAFTCTSSLTWGVWPGSGVHLNGEGRRVTFSRTVALTQPAEGERADYRMVGAQSANVTENVKAGTAKLTIVGNGTSLLGKAVLSGRSRRVSSTDCSEPHKRVVRTVWSSYTLKNGRSPLRTADIFGSMSIASDAYSFFHRETVRTR